jgi:hypothetical protein
LLCQTGHPGPRSAAQSKSQLVINGSAQNEDNAPDIVVVNVAMVVVVVTGGGGSQWWWWWLMVVVVTTGGGGSESGGGDACGSLCSSGAIDNLLVLGSDEVSEIPNV